jgi:EmrB/QacA subfamily drug resistance transporter
VERKWWTLVAVCTGLFMLLLDVTIVNVALPDIQHAFGASLSDLQWVIDAYALTLAALQLTAGSIADLAGRRRVYAAGIAIFSVGSLACGLSGSVLALSLSRAFQGIGGAIMFATGLSLLANAFHGKDRGVAFGVFGAVSGLAVAAGPIVGGALIAVASWEWIFYVNVPVGLLALVVTLLRVDESSNPKANRPDWIGFVTFSGGLSALVYALIRSHADGWGSPTIVACLVASALLLTAFVLAQLRGKHPMVDLRLLRVPTFTGGLIAAVGISASIFSVLTFLVIYLQGLLGFTPLQTGVRTLPLSLAIFVTAAIAGRLTSKVPAKWLITPGFVLVTAGLLSMRGLTPTSTWTHLLPGLILAGVGAGLINVPLASTAVGVVPPQQSGMASGASSTFRQVGIATGIAVLGSIFASHVQSVVAAQLAGGPLAGQADRFAAAVSSGAAGQAIAGVPAAARAVAAQAAAVGFVNGINRVLLIGACISAVAAVTSLLLIRQQDFVPSRPQPQPTTEPAAESSSV